MLRTETPEYMLRKMCGELGLLNGLSVDGSAIVDPDIQLGQIIEAKVDNNSRLIGFVANSPEDSTSDIFSEDIIIIVVMGKADRSDFFAPRVISRTIFNELSKASRSADGTIFGAIPSGAQGPFYHESGRVVYEVPVRLLTAS